MRPKLGLIEKKVGDAEMINDWLKYLHDNALDYTLSFRELATRIEASDPPRFGEFEQRWRLRVANQAIEPTEALARMGSVNPIFIPRNHRIEQAIQDAVAGDLTVFKDLNIVLAQPFLEQPEYAQYADAPEPNERVTQTFCGT
jgi:uncharacterized protein YdiU (UPF0061 family)